MGSSNKHWPSLFKSSRSNQRHHDDNNNNNNKAPVVEERTPEPKPRWNPKPEQIRILESIFNSGMVNPTREEIRRIRLRLEEYGDVGDANVFYWFQNRKSRSKNKKRQAQAAAEAEAEAEAEDEAEPELEAEQNPYPPPPVNTFLGQYSSSSSSSDNSADHMGLPFFTNSPTASVNQQAFYQSTPNDFLVDPLFYSNAASAPGFYIPDASSNLTIGNAGINLDPQLGLASFPPTTTTTVTNSHSLLPPPSTTVPSTLYYFQGLGGMQKVNVFINDMEFEVDAGPFNVKETFGDDAVLVHSSGHVVITNEWGVTLHPLQNGAFYYLIMM